METKTWKEFTKGKMSKYMKSEGSHGGAMRRMSKEWAEYKTKHLTVTKQHTRTKKISKKIWIKPHFRIVNGRKILVRGHFTIK